MAIEQCLFRDSVEELHRLAQKVSDNPVLIAMYGHPNSGKSHFSEDFKKFAQEKGKNVGWCEGPRDNHAFKYAAQLHYFLIHCIPSDAPFVDELMTKGLGRPADLSVLIYNPNLIFPFREDKPVIPDDLKEGLDLVIMNPYSTRKEEKK